MHFHGDAFEFVRNKIFNARSWQAPPTAANPDTRDNLKRNQFGGTFGGPIIKDKTFFFAGYQGTTLRNLGSKPSPVVPTQVQRDAATDPAIQNLLKFIPVGDASGKLSSNLFQPDHENTSQVIARGDQVISANDQLALRFVYSRFTKQAVFDPTNILTYADGSKITQQNSLIHETHVFSGTKVNAFRLSYAREIADRGPDPTHQRRPPGAFCCRSTQCRACRTFAYRVVSRSVITIPPSSSAITFPLPTTLAGC